MNKFTAARRQAYRDLAAALKAVKAAHRAETAATARDNRKAKSMRKGGYSATAIRKACPLSGVFA